MEIIPAPAVVPMTSAKNRLLVEIGAVIAIILGYAVLALAVKWWLYPGWTWKGYLSEVKAAGGLAVGISAIGYWLFQLYRNKSVDDALKEQARKVILSDKLSRITVIASVTTAALALAGFGLKGRTVERATATAG